MITTIMTMRMTMRMTVRNVRTHIHRLSLTDGPRIKCEQASITRTARQTRQQHLGGGHHWAHPLQQRTECPCRWYFFLWGAWEAGHVNYRPGADRCSVTGTGVGAGSLKILAGVLVHRATRPLRGSVSCGSGWSVPCVSIQLTLSQLSNTSKVRILIVGRYIVGRTRYPYR